MKRGWAAAASLGFVFVGALGARALFLPTLQADAVPAPAVAVNGEEAARRLSGALRFRTVDGDSAAAGEFPRFRSFLLRTFPRVAAGLDHEVVAGRSLLFTWRGTDPSIPPVLLLAHQDVVPVEPESADRWTHPPFAGDVEGGFVWGRGALDVKGSLMAAMEAMEGLLDEGFRPARTLYLGLGHDEETGGRGAAAMARLLETRNARPVAVLDEGMAVTDGMAPGVSVPVAFIGIAEKGYLSVEILAESPGGHASIPPPQGAAGVLSAAVTRVVENPFPARLRGPARDMFRFLAPEMSWPMRIVCSNLWVFGPLVTRKLEADPPTNAAVRTTTAVTMLESGVKENVLPARARAVLNLRLVPGDTVDEVLRRLRRQLKDLPVSVRALDGARDPSPVSGTETDAFRRLARTIREVFPGVVVAPGLVLGGTDARHFAASGAEVYRFVPIWIKAGDVARIHGIDERVSVERHTGAVAFYHRLIRNWTR